MSICPLPVLISEELFLQQNKKLKTFLKGVRKKFRIKNKTYYNYQNTKNAVLCGISMSKHWIRVLTIRALLQPECNGIRISKHWICTDKFTCCDNFAMARVLTSNGYEYSASLLCYYLMRGISINKQWICTVKFACFYLNAVALVSTSNEFEYPNSLVREIP